MDIFLKYNIDLNNEIIKKAFTHSSYVNDTPPTTAVSGNRGLASSILVVSGVIVTLIMYALLFIALVIK